MIHTRPLLLTLCIAATTLPACLMFGPMQSTSNDPAAPRTTRSGAGASVGTEVGACDDPAATQSCGEGACRITVPRCRDGVPVACQAAMNNRVPETCDGRDDDCDGVVDNAPGSTLQGTICTPAPTGCAPLRAVDLQSGATELRLDARDANACPSALTSASESDAHETVFVTLRQRAAVLVSSADASVELLARDGGVTRVMLATTGDLCARGVNTGVALLAAGTYGLRPSAASSTVAVRITALPVPEGTPAPLMPWESRVTFNTATNSDAVADCRAQPGVTTRVLVCPASRAHGVVFSSEQGVLVSLESSPTNRTCYPVSAGSPVTALLPDGDLVLLNAWPLGVDRGIGTAELR